MTDDEILLRIQYKRELLYSEAKKTANKPPVAVLKAQLEILDELLEELTAVIEKEG